MAMFLLLVAAGKMGWGSDGNLLNPCADKDGVDKDAANPLRKSERDREGARWQESARAGRSAANGVKRKRMSCCFCVGRFNHNVVFDQKAIWTSPFRLPNSTEDKHWLVFVGLGTLGLAASDKNIMRHFGSTPVAHSNSLSNYGVAAVTASAASLYLRGLAIHDDHNRETGFLAAEAAVDSVVVAEAMKLVFERPRPNAANAGTFGAGGGSFPSEHALAAWSMATVIAREYPGPLTKLLAYGAASGISDALDVLKAILAGSCAFFLVVRYGLGLKAFPLSVYPLEALLTFTLLTGIRICSRLWSEGVRPHSAAKRLLLVGAGHAAQMIIRETQEVETGYEVMGCVDDNPLKKGLRVLGVAVLGTVDMLPKVVSKEKIDEVLIAIPTASQTQMRRLVEICKAGGTAFRTVPEMSELIAGRATLQQAREVSLTDLLGRIPVDLDLEPVREHIRGRVVMVTGAAGSIGSELCRQIRTCKPRLLVCLDQNETGIFHLQHEFAEGGGETGQNVFTVADFSNRERMRRIFLAFGIQIVFHAAAYKHVPIMEANVEEAVSNNVFGLLSLLNVAESSNCSAFVLISSDKAVNPTNVMGCTKRIGELMLAAWPGERLRAVSVRFGNVLGSNGSAIPIFQEQIRQNQPITITHPEMTRFFMTVSEAVSLVLQAFAVGRSGDILVLDMGEPVRVADLAQTLVRLSGKAQQEFKFIGLRPGEKLFEELFYPEERVFPSACAQITCAESARPAWPELKRCLDGLYVAISLGKRAEILAQLQRIVPQFKHTGLAASTVTAPSILGAARGVSDAHAEAPTLTDTPRAPQRRWQANPAFGPPGGGPGK
jgi:FlaA1/EpsC-like NDP-sugar epimerase